MRDTDLYEAQLRRTVRRNARIAPVLSAAGSLVVIALKLLSTYHPH